MILKRIKVKTTLLEHTNCYIIVDENLKEAMVIDPAGDVDQIIELTKTLEARVKYIYLTHCHADHTAGVNELRSLTNAKVLIHRADAQGLEDDKINLATYIGLNEIIIKDVLRVDDKDKIHVGQLESLVIHTPGHTVGGSSLFCKEEKLLFSGDTMFRGTWGRTDLPTGNFEEIMNSITNKLLKLPDDTIVYPGHGKSTMIIEEKPIYEELKPRRD